MPLARQAFGGKLAGLTYLCLRVEGGLPPQA